jgi:oxygen-independent coproporphyrinogen-3 oxidase
VALRSVAAGPDALTLALLVDGRPVSVRVERPDAPTAWQRTRSFGLTLGEGTPPDAEAALRGWIDLVRAADPGGLALPGGAPNTRWVTSRGPPRPPLKEAAAARTDTGEALRFAAMVALEAAMSEDLYPHVTPLGVPTPFAEIAAGWRRALARRAARGPDKLGLYVHVPFCTVACTFCYCAKTDRFSRDDMSRYTDNLLAEAETFAPIFADQRFTSVYFGGGTPSLLSAPAMRTLFGALYRHFDVPPGTQVIYEGNPDSLDERKIQTMAEVGRVTRLTIGLQTLDDVVQKLVRRQNKPEQVEAAVRAARAAHIPHVNIDLMTGLPGQTEESFARDLDFVVALEPDSVHVNAFRPVPRVGFVRVGGAFDDADAERRDRMQAFARERLLRTGFGSDSGQGPRRTADAANLQEYDLRRQNSSLLGLGYPARAHSFGGHYYSPDLAPGVEPGLAADFEGRVWRAVASDEVEERHKYLVSNLRTGWDEAEFAGLFGVGSREVAPDALATLEALGLLTQRGPRWDASPMRTVEHRVAQVLLYSSAHLARAREVWGPGYDPHIDYFVALNRMVGQLT